MTVLTSAKELNVRHQEKYLKIFHNQHCCYKIEKNSDKYFWEILSYTNYQSKNDNFLWTRFLCRNCLSFPCCNFQKYDISQYILYKWIFSHFKKFAKSQFQKFHWWKYSHIPNHWLLKICSPIKSFVAEIFKISNHV